MSDQTSVIVKGERPRLPESAKSRWGIGRAIKLSHELSEALERSRLVDSLIEHAEWRDSFLVMEYAREMPFDVFMTLRAALVSGCGGNFSAAGAIFLGLSTHWAESIRQEVGSSLVEARVAPLLEATKERQEKRRAAIKYASDLVGYMYKRQYVAALVDEFGVKASLAEAWLKYGREIGAFKPPLTYSQGGAPKKIKGK